MDKSVNRTDKIPCLHGALSSYANIYLISIKRNNIDTSGVNI